MGRTVYVLNIIRSHHWSPAHPYWALKWLPLNTESCDRLQSQPKALINLMNWAVRDHVMLRLAFGDPCFRPHLYRYTYLYTHVKGYLYPHAMHRCSIHPHAGSPIHVCCDEVAAQTQLLVPIWQQCGCAFPDADSVCTRTCRLIAIKLGPAADAASQ